MCSSEATNPSLCPELLPLERLEEKARKLGAFSLSAATAGNTIVLFTMLALQEMLEQLLVNPVANQTAITQLAASISSLNSSIRIVP